jgi:hypothetical protein
MRQDNRSFWTIERIAAVVGMIAAMCVIASFLIEHVSIH